MRQSTLRPSGCTSLTRPRRMPFFSGVTVARADGLATRSPKNPPLLSLSRFFTARLSLSSSTSSLWLVSVVQKPSALQNRPLVKEKVSLGLRAR